MILNKPPLFSSPRFDGIDLPGDSVRLVQSTVGSVQTELHLKLVLTALLTLTFFILLFTFREYDNNRLVSWNWAMSYREVLWILLYSSIGMAAAFFKRVREFPIGIYPFLFVASIMLAMTCWTIPELNVDSSRYFTHAKFIMNKGLFQFLNAWGQEVSAWTDLPLISMIYGVAFQSFGESRTVIQVINAVFFSLSILVVFELGRNLWNQAVGMYAALMLMSIPFLHIQASLMLVDIPSMLFVELALLVTLMAIKKGGIKMLLCASFLIVLAVLTKFSAWLVLSTVFLLPFVVVGQNQRVLAYKRLAAICLASGVVICGIMLTYHELIFRQIELLFGYNLPAFNRWQESFISTFAYQLHPFISIMAILSVFLAVKNKDARYLIILYAVAMFICLGVKRARYLVIVFPLITLMAAYGLYYINRSTIKNYVLICILAISVSITVVAYKPFFSQTSGINLKTAAQYLNTLPEQNVVVYALEQPQSAVNPQVAIPLLDYYMNKEVLLEEHADGGTRIPPFHEKSSMRFTWEQKLYPYKMAENYQNDKNVAIALILYHNKQMLPGYINKKLENYKLDKTFGRNDTVFRYQTVVSIYRHRDNV